jgi:hypothetical protein
LDIWNIWEEGEADTEIWGDEERKPLGRPRHKWGIILKLMFRKWDWGVEWIDLAQVRDR